MEPDAVFKRADINTVTTETSCLSGSPSAKQKLHSSRTTTVDTHALNVLATVLPILTLQRGGPDPKSKTVQQKHYKTSISYTHMHTNMHK